MQFDVRDFDQRPRYATYDSALAHFEQEVIHRVNADLHGENPVRVYGALVNTLHGRLPGVDLDERNLWAIAGAISNGTFPHHAF